MIISRRSFVTAASALAITNKARSADELMQEDIPIQSGPFSASSSFESSHCPEWFRDAKFGKNVF